MFNIQFNNDGTLLFVGEEGKRESVYIKRCFPWSGENEFLSLKNFKDEEIHLIENVKDLSIDDQRALRDYFDFNELKLEVRHVLEINENFELRTFEVITVQGKRTFQMKKEDYPSRGANGEVFFEDLSGDLLFIKNLESLDKDSRKKLSFLID